MVSAPCLLHFFIFPHSTCRSDLDAAAAAAASMGLEMPAPMSSKPAPKAKLHHDAKGKSAADAKGKGAEADNDKRREDLRSTGECHFELPQAHADCALMIIAVRRFAASSAPSLPLMNLNAWERMCVHEAATGDV